MMMSFICSSSLLRRAVEGPVADDRTSAFPPSGCCGRGAWRVRLRRQGGRQRGRGPGGARRRPCGAARRSCAGAGPLPRAVARLAVGCVLLLGRVPPSPETGRSPRRGASLCGGGGRPRRGAAARRRAVGGGLRSGPPSSASVSTSGLSLRFSLPTVIGCRLGGFPAGRGRWGGERVVGGVLPRISVGAWGLGGRL